METVFEKATPVTVLSSVPPSETETEQPSPGPPTQSVQNYEFVREPPKEFFCPVSFELLLEPQQTDCCGHHVTLEVARRLREEGRPCPICQQPHFTTHADKFHGRKVREVSVRCPHRARESGCEWEGELGDLGDHVRKCPNRPWQCIYCGYVIYFVGVVSEEEHLSVCQQFPVPCPNGCEVGRVKRCDTQQHVLDCPLQVVDCDYADLGCKVSLPRREMKTHIASSQQEHMLQMCAANLMLSQEMSRKMAEKDEQIAQLQLEMKKMEGRVTEKMRGNKVEICHKVSEAVAEEVKVAKVALERQIISTGNEMKDLAKILISGIPPVEYIIPNFSVLRENETWMSSPFYTHYGGYKMCIEVFPNGFITPSHVSLKFLTMRDSLTDYLKWPAKLIVTIHVLNHRTGKWEREYIDGISFTRNKPAAEVEVSSYCSKYLPHSKLAPYIKDDCFHIRVDEFIYKM